MSRLPHTLAHPLEQFEACRKDADWFKSANYMLDFFEASSQYVSIVLLGMFRDAILSGACECGGDTARAVAKIDGKRPLSFGDWCNDILPVLLKDAVNLFPEHPLVLSLSNVISKKRNVFLGSKNEKSIVQVRNEYKGHSTTLSESIYADVVAMLLPRLEEWRTALAPLENYDDSGLDPLVHRDAKGHEYVFQSLKEESVSFISVDEDALTYIGDDYNEKFDAWMQVLVPSFDISKDLNWGEYVGLTHGISAGYMDRIYAQKKYNRELFVERTLLSKAYGSFVDSDKTIFPLLGEAGQGKTNQLCHWTESLVKSGDAVMIFAGADFADMSLADRLREEFGLSKRKAIGRFTDHLHATADANGKNVYLFFDAVNECMSYPHAESDGYEPENAPLLLFRDICSIFGKPEYKRFKLLFTCRTYTWHQLLLPELKNVDSSVFYNRGAEEDTAVRGFTDAEVAKAYDIYGELYQMATAFHDLKRTCVLRLKDPLMLKIACTNYLGKALPEDSAQYCSIALWDRMMQDISASYAGRRQKEIVMRMADYLLSVYESGETCDSLLVSRLKNASEDDPMYGLAELMFRKEGISIAFAELLNKPERPILRMVDGEKVQFIYERFLEYVMSRSYYLRERAGLSESETIPAGRIVETLGKAAVNEVFMETMSSVLVMDYVNSGNSSTIISLLTDYGDNFMVMSLVTDVLNTLVQENYEKELFAIERLLLTRSDAGTDTLVREYNRLAAMISSNKADVGAIERHRQLSSSLSSYMRLRQLGSATLLNGIYLTDYHNESLYTHDPYSLFLLLMDETVNEVRDNGCMLVYYLFKKTHTLSYTPLKENITEQIVHRMLSTVTDSSMIGTVAAKKKRSRAVVLLEAAVRMDVLMIIDTLLAGGDQRKVIVYLDDIRLIFSHFTWNFRLIKMLMPFFDFIMRRQFTFQSAYVNNVNEYQTFWDPSIVAEHWSEDRWSREDLKAIGPFIGCYSTWYSPSAARPRSEAPDFKPVIDRILLAYRTGDSLSYFVLERILVIMAVCDWEIVRPLMEQLRYGDYARNEWFDYSQMSLIYSLYQMGMKMDVMPDFVWDMLGEWSVDWTRRCRGYFKGHNSATANPSGLYKRNVMTWYAMVYARRHGDAADPEKKSVPAFRALVDEALETRDRELLVHLINNISELVTDSGYILTALDLLKMVLYGIPDRETLDSFVLAEEERYPDTKEDIIALVGKVLGTAKNYFPREVNHFLKNELRSCTFPGLNQYKDSILGFNPGGEKLSDLFTHKFGNFVIWSLINVPVVDEVASDILDALTETGDSVKWFDRLVRIVFARMFDVKL